MRAARAATLTGGTRLTQYGCDPWLEHGREQIYRLAPSQSGTVSVTMSSPDKDLDLIVLGETALDDLERDRVVHRAERSRYR